MINPAKFLALSIAAMSLLISFAITACDGPTADEVVAESPPSGVGAMPPVYSARDFADRVFYQGGGTREWGTLCRIDEGQWVSVHHVTVNGTPAVGPKAEVTAFDEASDWSFAGVDPATLDPEDFGAVEIGHPVLIAGFPARDLDGEIIPGRFYLHDLEPPFVWVELLPLAGGAPPEGVVGGISGSCVLDNEFKIVGVVHANGFSPIEGTTNTWAKIVPIRDAIAEARGEVDYATATALSAFDPSRVPKIETGRHGLTGGD